MTSVGLTADPSKERVCFIASWWANNMKLEMDETLNIVLVHGHCHFICILNYIKEDIYNDTP